MLSLLSFSTPKRLLLSPRPKWPSIRQNCSQKSVSGGDEIAAARNWLQNSTPDDILRHNFHISYSRASGPGGQKVNKTSSKATVSLAAGDWLGACCRDWMPHAVLDQLQGVPFRYQTKAGGILVQSEISRNQQANVDDCFRKLLAEIKTCVHFPSEVQDSSKAKWRNLAVKAKAQRIRDKKRLSEKKQARKKAFDV